MREAGFLERFQAAQPGLHALVRNTCSITILGGSDKINVVSPRATAELDCRILPDQDAEAFLEEIKSRIDDDQIRVEEIMLFGPTQSRADTELYEVIETISEKHYPDAGVVAAVAPGFTDSHFFRDLGIVSYGYAPIVVPEEDIRSVHGNNERIVIATFRRGVDMMTETVAAFAARR
jgi:acetylornithine deacetylase/succinyl-diaminopimelate desuccinylase-like protein